MTACEPCVLKSSAHIGRWQYSKHRSHVSWHATPHRLTARKGTIVVRPEWGSVGKM